MQTACLGQRTPLHTEWCGSRSTKHPPQIKQINILTAPSLAHRKCCRGGFNWFGLRSIEMVVLVSGRSENNYAGNREDPSVPLVQSGGLCDAIMEDKYVRRHTQRAQTSVSQPIFPCIVTSLVSLTSTSDTRLQDRVGCFMIKDLWPLKSACDLWKIKGQKSYWTIT